ncbi:lipopolysaccharide biosynthesis protein [Sphingomonas sp.]|uniref:lipopolysaccharide biosynthesis protein n=1 Tax=Sphingomonas sp. TaxID=28214 RepID=UPI003FA72E34
MVTTTKDEESERLGLTARVRGAVMWRSGAQVVSQLIMWGSTFLVIRILDPRDYGLFAMTQVVLVFLHLMNGYGFANALVRNASLTREQIAQAFGLLILLNGGLALAQLALAPLAAAYFRQPEVATLLRVQALLYVATPFTALPTALLSRRLDFRRQAQAALIGAIVGAGTALAAATAGWGVWTLVAAPIAMFWAQAAALTWAARSLIRPSFRFKGAEAMVRYGSAMVVVQFFWFIQSQSDVFIAGRVLAPHDLGVYTTALFLTQILSSKFIPPLNDVAFAAYSHMQARADAIAFAFLRAVRLIMLIVMPFYLGLAITAEPLVLTVLGPKWAETIPLVQLLALAMPFMALQILFVPANNALGHTRVAVRIALAGAVVMPLSFLVGIRFGTIGLAWATFAAFPTLTAVTALLSIRVIGVRISELARAVMPGLLAAGAMALAVLAADSLLPPMLPQPRLALLVLTGVVAYAGLLLLFARPLVDEVTALLRKPVPATG